MSPRKLLRALIFSSLSLYLTTIVVPGFTIDPGFGNLVFVTLALTILNLIIRPIVKLLLLPINLVTLGAFRWLTTIIILYILTWIIPEVNISSFSLSTMPFLGWFLPEIILGKFFGTVLTALALTTIHRLLYWLTKS